MEKRITYFFKTIMTLLVLILSGCTQNNGYIGDWFGFWRVVSVEIDGKPSELYKGNIVWSFEGSIIFMTINGEAHDSEERVGTWEESDDSRLLTIDFTHWRDQGNKAYLYRIPQDLSLPGDKPFVMTIISSKSGERTLEWISDEGKRQVYTLRKVY